MFVMLAVALNLAGWRGPVVFIVLAVSAIVVLTRLIEWGVKLAKRPKAIEIEGPKPYDSYETKRSALGDGENLDDWLDRVHVTPVAHKIKPHSRFWIYGPGVCPNRLFHYYRVSDERRMLKYVEIVSLGFAKFQTEELGKTVVRSFENLSVAYPRAGEWWEKTPCAKHSASPCSPRVVTKEDGWFFDSARIAELECGCLVPDNFGKGTPKSEPIGGSAEVPPLMPFPIGGFIGVQGSGGAVGTGGVHGDLVSHAINTLIRENSKGLERVVSLKKLEEAKTCPSCSGTGYAGPAAGPEAGRAFPCAAAHRISCPKCSGKGRIE